MNKEEFRSIVTNNCYYCNKPPSQVRSPLGITNIPEYKRIHAEFIYNGVDRIDNSKGYEIGNVIPCCKRDNYIKGNQFTVEETKVMVDALENHYKSKGII